MHHDGLGRRRGLCTHAPGVDRCEAAPAEGFHVRCDRDAVEFDRPLQGRFERKGSACGAGTHCPSGTGSLRSRRPSGHGQPGRVDEFGPFARRPLPRSAHVPALGGERPSRRHGRRCRLVARGVDRAQLEPGRILEIALRGAGGQHVATEHEVRFAGGDALGAQAIGLRRDATCEVTAPFFWLMPVMSSTRAPSFSRCAAIPISAPTVITPVPPMPVMRMLYGSRSTSSVGSGRGSPSHRRPRLSRRRPVALLRVPP